MSAHVLDQPRAVARVLERLEDVRRNGSEWSARCPAHEDERASLTVNAGDDGRALVRCHAGCDSTQIVEALGLQFSDLFADDPKPKRQRRRILKTYDYNDARGELVYQVVRYEPKDFRQRQPKPGGGYEWNLKGVDRVLYRLPSVRVGALAGDFVFVVEGEKDADNLDALAVVATCNAGGAGKRWEASYTEALRGARVVILPDNDKPGREHAAKVFGALNSANVAARVVELPNLPPKGDASDWIRAGGTKEQLLELADAAHAAPAERPTEPESTSSPEPEAVGAGEGELSSRAKYEVREDGTYWLKPTSQGIQPRQLCNFACEVLSEAVLDDGVEESRFLDLSAKVRGRTIELRLSVAEFRGMGWPIERLGVGAVVESGAGFQDHLRCAIQRLSGEVPSRRIYRHLGWRKLESGWVYLHGEGGIGAGGRVELEVELDPALSGFVLPEPPEGDALRAAVRSSLNLLRLAPERVTFPLYGAIWRSLFGKLPGAVSLVAPSGVGKSALAALVQQHFGAELDAEHLPANWISSTENALCELLFAGKDALVIVDEYKVSGESGDEDRRIKRCARNVLQSYANGAIRQRLRRDGSFREPRPPRCGLVSTGEEPTGGESLEARQLVVQIAHHEGPTPDGRLGMSRPKSPHLDACQRDAERGVYAAALAAFVSWLAPRLEGERELLKEEERALRESFDAATHPRTIPLVCSLLGGLRSFARFALEVGALSEEEVERFLGRAHAGLQEAANVQAEEQQLSDPLEVCMGRLREAVSSGRAHFADPSGDPPPSPGSWGWRRRPRPLNYPERGRDEEEALGRRDPSEFELWEYRGERVGWVDDEEVFVLPNVLHDVISRSGGSPLSPRMLPRRLHEAGKLVTTERETARKRYTVRRRNLEGKRQEVLHLRATEILGEPEGVLS